MSPIRGVDALQGGRGGNRFVPPNVRKKKKKGNDPGAAVVPLSHQRSPFSHALLQIREQKLTVEGVNGGDVGEDVLHNVDRERPLVCLLH